MPVPWPELAGPPRAAPVGLEEAGTRAGRVRGLLLPKSQELQPALLPRRGWLPGRRGPSAAPRPPHPGVAGVGRKRLATTGASEPLGPDLHPCLCSLRRPLLPAAGLAKPPGALRLRREAAGSAAPEPRETYVTTLSFAQMWLRRCCRRCRRSSAALERARGEKKKKRKVNQEVCVLV